ncbi:498_t:CDS:1, partial [Ambispora leptoticha]
MDEVRGFKVIVRANPAGIMYKFESKKVLFRYSEDLNFTLDADQLEKASRNFLVKAGAGVIKFFTAGLVDGEEALKQEAGLGDATKNYLHGSDDDDKSKDERQSERKKTLASAGSSAMSAVIGSIPSLLDASHTHGNYSLAELALRFE